MKAGRWPAFLAQFRAVTSPRIIVIRHSGPIPARNLPSRCRTASVSEVRSVGAVAFLPRRPTDPFGGLTLPRALEFYTYLILAK